VIEHGWRWHILADPDGNEFCVLQPLPGARNELTPHPIGGMWVRLEGRYVDNLTAAHDPVRIPTRTR